MELYSENSLLAVKEVIREHRPNLVMYCIVNADLNMSTGKIAGQVGHSVDLALSYYFSLLEKFSSKVCWSENNHNYYLSSSNTLSDKENKFLENFTSWQLHGRTKVVLKASQKEFEKLKNEEDYFLVRDAGLTEIAPNSETVLSLPPILKEDAPKIIKKMRLL
jgi:peptidyl-tRNA hydrolase